MATRKPPTALDIPRQEMYPDRLEIIYDLDGERCGAAIPDESTGLQILRNCSERATLQTADGRVVAHFSPTLGVTMDSGVSRG